MYILYICVCVCVSFMEMLYHISPRLPDWYFPIFGNQPKLSLRARGTKRHLQEVSGLALHLLLNSHPSGHNSPHCASWLSKLIGNYGLTSGLMVDLPLSIYRVDAALNPPNKKSKKKQNHWKPIEKKHWKPMDFLDRQACARQDTCCFSSCTAAT